MRELRGGDTIAVTRSFSVRFVPLPAGGHEVEGEQVGIEVAAPEKMAPFAELERKVRFTAEADPRTGLMSRASREIVTTIGSDRRTTQEQWTLGPF